MKRRARRIYIAPDRLLAAEVTVTGAEHNRLARVLRLRAGDAVVVFDGGGGERDAVVARVSRSETTLALAAPQDAPATAAPPVIIVTAVPRGARMDFLVQKTTELGVARIVPIVTARSTARPGAGGAHHVRWQSVAREAARQCGRADVPRVDGPATLAAALSSTDLPACRLALWEGERGRPLRAALGPAIGTALLIGPEGGFEAAEIDAARAAHFVPVGLGARVLRVETAAVVALALVQDAYGQLGGIG